MCRSKDALRGARRDNVSRYFVNIIIFVLFKKKKKHHFIDKKKNYNLQLKVFFHLAFLVLGVNKFVFIMDGKKC